MKTIFLSCLISLFSSSIFCQSEVIHLKNPSFEDYSRAERVPEGWIDCGFPGESAPDTHPSGAFNVTQAPANGQSYLGMVVRDNDTWEGIGQHLDKPLVGGKCYTFRIGLCRSSSYVSLSRNNGQRANYIEPVKLVIWGGNNFCEKLEKLGETQLVNHTDWKAYQFNFQPKQDYNYIKLEAFYKQPILLPYNGNLLIDNASPIIPIPCDSMASWSDKKYDELFSEIKPVYVKIEPSDIDATAQNTATVRADRNVLKEPISAIYYNSNLDAAGRTNALKEIVEFLNDDPSSRANIIIQEHSKAARKLQKQKLLRDLKQLGIDKSKCNITLLKK